MNSKTISLSIVSILAVLILVGMASAASLTVANVVSPANTTHDAGTFTVTFDLTNAGTAATTLGSVYTSTQGATITFSQDTIADGSTTAVTQTITATVTLPAHKSGNVVIDISGDADGTGGEFTVPTITVPILDSNTLTLTQKTALTKTQNGTVTITNTGNTQLTNLALEVADTAAFTVAFGTVQTSLSAGAAIDVEVTSTDVTNLDLGEDNTLNIKAVSTEANSSNLLITIPASFYEGANQGQLDVSSFDINVKEGFGDDEDYWYPLDEVEVEFDVENKGNWDIKDVEVKVCLLDTRTGDCVMDEDDMDLSDDKFDLDEDDDEQTVLLTFTLDPKDLSEDSTKYELYVSAIGEIDDSDSAYDNQETGESRSETIEIRTDENFIVIEDFEFSETVQCGAEVTLSADVWNLDDSKIDEDEIFIWAQNADLGINQRIDFKEDIGALDKETLELYFTIPANVAEKSYTIEFIVYDDDSYGTSDVYENSEEDEAKYYATIKVEGGCGAPSATNTVVSASLESGGEAGKELVVKATVSNTGTELSTYTLNAAGYTGWAESAKLDATSLVLGAGESKEVMITFQVKKDASGENTFNLEVLSGTELVANQPVAVSIEASSGVGSNWHLWLIGALNVILVIIIIVVAVRVARS